MPTTEYIIKANAIMIQHFARSYLSPAVGTNPILIEGASIKLRSIKNRTGVPFAAKTFSILVENPELGFSFRFRAVWFDRVLLMPTATHVVIEQEWDDADLGSPDNVSIAINEWLQAVTP